MRHNSNYYFVELLEVLAIVAFPIGILLIISS